MAEIAFNIFPVQVVLSKADSLASEPLVRSWGFEKELRSLHQTISVLQSFLGDAPEQSMGREVEFWVEELNDIVHDADDLLDEINYELLQHELEIQKQTKRKVPKILSLFLSNTISSLFRPKMAYRIKKVDASLVDLMNEFRLIFVEETPVPIPWDRQSHSFIRKDGIVGREKAVSDIITTLTNSNINQEILSVMAIVGMPGLGKTTLAQLVYKEDKINRHFDEKIWICVSYPFDVKCILIKILEELVNHAMPAGMQRWSVLRKGIHEHLTRKRCLLILDDVWNEDLERWSNLMGFLSTINLARGSAIVVTTRSAKVAEITGTFPIYNLEYLSVDECWCILKNRAFPDSSAPIDAHLEAVGREIAEMCGGVPLLAQVLGGILRSKNHVGFLSILQSRIWELPQAEERIMLVMKSSFDNLESPSLKLCFTYLSMFKKDSEIERDDLIQLWMAQGWLDSYPRNSTSDQEMEDIGNEYFHILLESSLLQPYLTKDDFGSFAKCKMHNLVHDFAEFVSKLSGRLTWDSNVLVAKQSTRHVAHASTPVLKRIRERSVRGLRSFFFNGEVPINMLPKFKALHVLNLYRADIEELPISIGELKQLRYLNVSGTEIKELPTSIGKLLNLQTLRMQHCINLKVFPKEVQDLVHLRHIYFDQVEKTRHHDFRWYKEFPVRIGQLTNLRTIPYFIVEQDTCGIEELASLNKLKGELTIYDLEHVRNGEEAKKANLVEKRNIRKLTLVWGEERNPSNRSEENVLDGLNPPSMLEVLEIHNFMGAKFPSWKTLNNLKKIRFLRCDICEEVPMLAHLPNLMHLEVDTMSNLKRFGAELYGYNDDADEAVATTSTGKTKVLFPALKTLRICIAPNLVEWATAPVVPTEPIVMFPCLEELALLECSQLRNVPNHLPSLRQLEISLCHELSKLPVLEKCTSLRNLEISSCDSLTSISMHNLSSLRKLVINSCGGLTSLHLQSRPELLSPVSLLEVLSIKWCRSLESFPTLSGCTSLRELTIADCDGLRSLPSGLEKCTSLRNLEISSCDSLTSISVHSLTSLRKLTINSCGKLTSLHLQSRPELLFPVSLLEVLSIKWCRSLESFPTLSGCTSLREFTIADFDGLRSLPGGLENCTSLQNLEISSCDSLTSISMHNFTSIRKLVINSCGGLTSLHLQSRPELLSPVSLLEVSSIKGCRSLESFPALPGCTSLRELTIAGCDGLRSLPSGLEKCTSLWKLVINSCGGLTSMNLQSGPELFPPVSLEELSIRWCTSLLESFPTLQGYTSLRRLTIADCDVLRALPSGLHSLTCLKYMKIGKFWEELDSFPAFEVPSQVKDLQISGWPKLKSLPQQIQRLASLTSLTVDSFDGVEALPEWLGNLTSLTYLRISSCKDVMHLPSVRAIKCLTKLQVLVINECPILKERCDKVSGSEWHKISHIPKIEVD